jgi:hypothetical protein
VPYNPKNLLVLKAEIQINGVWTTITSRARSAGKVKIKHGMGDGASGPETSVMRCQLGNDDGWLTEGNPSSPWWPYIGRGTPIRFSLTGILGSDAGRFAGEIDYLEAVYPGGSSSAMYIEAIGTWGTLVQNDEMLRSPLYRTMLGGFAGDIAPAEYWPLEDGHAADQFASAIGGPPGLGTHASGGTTLPVPSGFSGIPGSATAVSVGESARVVLPVRAYADTGQWAIQGVFQFEADTTSNDVAFFAVLGNGQQFLVGLNDSPQSFDVAVLAANLSLIYSNSTAIAGSDIVGEPFSLVLASTDTVPGDDLVALLLDGDGNIRAQTNTTNVGYGTLSQLYIEGSSDRPGASHIGLFTDPTFDPDVDTLDTARAMSGWAGETVEERISRLALEEGLSVTVVGDSAQRMGPQRVAKLTDLFIDCRDVDQGIWSDSRTGLGLAYRCLSDLYNQSAQVAVVRGALTPDAAPVWDYRQIRNEWTVSRIDGSSATASDEQHIARVRRRLKGSATLNLFADATLPDQAGWRVNVSTAPGPRYPALGINLRNVDGAQLADVVLGAEAGDRLTVAAAALPDQHPPGGADQLVVGWEEEIDRDFWEFRPVAVPASPYTVAEVDANPRVSATGSTLSGSLTSTATTFSLASTVANGVWTTLPADFPLDVNLGGERITLSGISGASSPQTATVATSGRSVNGVVKAHASGTAVDVWEPAVVAL